MSKLVRKTLADTPITPARKRKLDRLAERPDSEIDFSEIPPLTDKFWNNAVCNPFYRPIASTPTSSPGSASKEKATQPASTESCAKPC